MNPIKKYFYYSAQRKLLKNNEDNMLKRFVEKKCVFFHIPKAGGISVSSALFKGVSWGHRSVEYYQKVLGMKRFDESFKFTFVRNPYDRLWSAFHFLKSGGLNEVDRRFSEKELKQYVDFESFVIGGLKQKEMLDWVHFKPQHSFVCDKNGALCVDYVGKLETIEKSFEEVCKILGSDVPIEHHNKSRKTPRKISDESKSIIKLVYKKDFDLFYPTL